MKDTLSEKQIQEMAQLVYIDILDSFGENTTIAELYDDQGNSVTIGQLIDYYTTLEEGSKEFERFKERFSGEVYGEGIQEYERIQQFLKDLKPYEDWRISNVVSNNKKEESGFVGYTIQPDPINNPGKVIVSFRGSEPAKDLRYFNDWKNNLSTLYLKQSIQQKEAEKYIKDLEKNLGFEINELYLTGHSLGGNLALFSSFVLSKELREKLVTATTFNAPGFNLKTLAYYKEAIDELNKLGKITEFQNRYDVVPAFMQNPSIGVLIDSTSSKGNFSSDHHSMFNLKQEDGIFARSESQTREPHTVFVYRFSMNFESIPDFLMSDLIETISDVVEANEFKLSDIPKIITAVGKTRTLLTIATFAAIETINDVVKDEIKRKLLQTGVQVTLAVVRAKQSYDNFTNNLKRKAFKKGVEFTIGLAKAHQEYTRIRDELRSKLLQRGVEFVVDIIKAHLAWKRFKDNLRSKVIQKGVEAVFTLAKANQAWNSFKEGLKRKALQKGVKFTISLIKSKQSSGYSKLLGNTINLVKKLTVRLIRGSAKASKGPRIIANVDRLLALQKSIQRNADTVSQLVRQIQSTASNINSNVGRRYHEWYVQSQIRQIENQLAQVRKVEREAYGKLQSLSEGVRFSVQKYRQVEAQLQFKT